MEKWKCAHKVLVGKPARNIPLGRPGHRMDYSGSGQRHVGGILVNMQPT